MTLKISTLVSIGSLAMSGAALTATAADNPFALKPLTSGYQMAGLDFAAVDKNGNGKITAEEYGGDAAVFKAKDKNQDGHLEAAEYGAKTGEGKCGEGKCGAH